MYRCSRIWNRVGLEARTTGGGGGSPTGASSRRVGGNQEYDIIANLGQCKTSIKSSYFVPAMLRTYVDVQKRSAYSRGLGESNA